MLHYKDGSFSKIMCGPEKGRIVLPTACILLAAGILVDSLGKLLTILWFNGVNIANVNIFSKENNVNNTEHLVRLVTSRT